MRIALGVLELTRGNGGAERVAAELANEMVRRGHQVAIYSDANEDECSTYPLDQLICHIKIPSLPDNMLAIEDAIRDFKPDGAFIFYYNIKSLIIPYTIFENLGLPIGVQECTNPMRAVHTFAGHATMNGSEDAARDARDAFLAGAQRIRFTMPSYRDSAPPQAIANVRTFFNAFPLFQTVEHKNEGIRAIISVGGLKRKNKNGSVLLQAFATIAEEYPDWELRIYGEPGRDITPAIGPYQNHPQVKLCGATRDIHAAYDDAQIHVICSFDEGCPNTVCEAMCHGVPSIGFADCAGTNILIRNEENGLLIERDDEVTSLTRALRRLMSDATLRQRLGWAAYSDASVFEPKQIFDQWEALLRDVCETPRFAETRADVTRSLLLMAPVSEHARRSYVSRAPLVSFVVPLFNKEKYVRDTLRSIAKCGYANKEIIVVDDKSTDRSAVLTRTFKHNHPNVPIKVISHAENRGLSSARNTGLAEAKGKYIQFWDADDIYGDQLLPLISEIEEDRSDIGTGVATRESTVISWYRSSAISRRATTFDECPQAFAASSTCFKLYRREFLEKNALRFIDGLHLQDTEFNLRAFPLASRITVTPRPIGEYRWIGDSASKHISEDRLNSSLEIERLTRAFYEVNAFHRFETFRQAKVITFVFQNFIIRLLEMHLRPAPTDPLSASTVSDYLMCYGKALIGLQHGIRDVAVTDPLRAIGYVAVAAGNFEWALKLLTRGRHGLPDRGFECVIASERIGFSASEIAAIFASATTEPKAEPV